MRDRQAPLNIYDESGLREKWRRCWGKQAVNRGKPEEVNRILYYGHCLPSPWRWNYDD
ncbi:MAG: hypothetical protein RDV48_23925 [Candidatus Eremiobacteraeota bacterium]|nr:hypothetical protein [Candidatus Eremiobacteraeota bacterium]